MPKSPPRPRGEPFSKVTKATHAKHDYTAPRGTYEREKQTQKRPKNHICDTYNLNETPYYTTLQAFNTAQTQHQQAQPHANPQSCVMNFCKSGADADCVGAARHFCKKKKFQRISQHTAQTPILPSKRQKV